MVVMTLVVIMTFVVIVSMLIAMLVSVVVVVMVCSTHCCNGNGERFDSFCFEFEDVFSGFELVNRDCCVCWAVA
jgi:multidrug efflux pump subunit AcrB